MSVSALGVVTTTANSTTANFGITDSGNNVVISIPAGNGLYGQNYPNSITFIKYKLCRNPTSWNTNCIRIVIDL